MAFTTKAHGITTPQTNFATRKLAFVVVDMNTDVATDYNTIGSLFQRAVQGIQQIAEIYALGQPSGQYFYHGIYNKKTRYHYSTNKLCYT